MGFSSWRKHRILVGIGGSIAVLLVAAFIASYFLDDIVRAHTESAMNSKLKGYHVSLGNAHLQLIGGSLTLSRLLVIQQAHPKPPVMDVASMRFRVQWRPLLAARVVADVTLRRPRLHIDKTQLVAEKNDKVPLKQKGWQDALESIYPVKINRFVIDNGDLVYIQDKTSPPLHLANVNFTSNNIRNIFSPNNVYPSSLHANLVIFGTGRATIDGNANYLEEPFPGARVKYSIENVPLSAFDPEIREINIGVKGGRLSSSGTLEYSPKLTDVEVDKAAIDRVDLSYVHRAATRQQEAQRVKATGSEIAKQNNRPKVNINVRDFKVTDSILSFIDESKDPNYRLFISQTQIELKNLSNHATNGPSTMALHGLFLGSGRTEATADFLAGWQGPAFDMNIAIHDTNMTAMNDLLRAYGRFDVAAGRFSVFSQIHVRNSEISGYVKPLFSNLTVYEYQREKHTGVLHQAKELAIGAAAKIFTNRSTEQVATQVDLKGKLTGPNISTWQAIVEVLRNAFVQAILPGFDRSVAQNRGG